MANKNTTNTDPGWNKDATLGLFVVLGIIGIWLFFYIVIPEESEESKKARIAIEQQEKQRLRERAESRARNGRGYGITSLYMSGMWETSIREHLKDPDSYEWISTKKMGEDMVTFNSTSTKRIKVEVKFRARNSFGGMGVSIAEIEYYPAVQQVIVKKIR